MKKNFYTIFLILLIVGLLLNRFALPAGGLTLIIGTAALIIGYIVKGLQNFKTQEYSKELRIMSITTSFYLALTLIGIVFRHQWWALPFYGLIFKILWPLLTLGLLVQLIIYLTSQAKSEKKEIKKRFAKNTLVPLVLIVLLAIPTFLTSTETFCKIYKPYTADELYKRWEVEKIE